jgi:phosphatidate cytidylyltransferase
MTVSGATAKWGDLLPRTLSAVFMIPIVLAMVFYGGVWFQLLVAIAGVLMAREYVAIADNGNDLQFALHALGALAAVIAFPVAGVMLTLVIMAALIVLSNLHLNMRQVAVTMWQRIGVGYVALPALALMIVRGNSAGGLMAALFLLLLVWSADTFAYFAGRIIGGPKLAPKLSPKKTWAGLGGAAAGAALVAAGFLFFGKASGAAPFILLAVFLAVFEQGGDILESALKRAHNIKDSGNLILGHGGMLDRVDGLMAVFVAAALIGCLHNALDPAAGVTNW